MPQDRQFVHRVIAPRLDASLVTRGGVPEAP